MLGRFLEISVHAPDILASLAFYESLGFVQASTNEIRSYPYAVITDGRLFMGLHQHPIKSPTLCFVQSNLLQHRAKLQQPGVCVDHEQLGQDSFNELGFHDPSGLRVRLLEARTFSLPDIDPGFISSCGYFTELGVPVKEFDAMRRYWEALDFVAMEEHASPFQRMTLTSHHLNIGLHRSRALRHCTLVFEDDNMRERLSHLKERGFALSDEMPDNLDEHCNAVLQAPEGTQLLLMQSNETN
jgi:hypothetical protein